MQSLLAARPFETVQSDTCSTRKRTARDLLFGTLTYGALLSRSSVVSKSAFLREREQIERARESLSRKIGEDDEFGMC